MEFRNDKVKNRNNLELRKSTSISEVLRLNLKNGNNKM